LLLLTLPGFPKDEPITMPAPAVVGFLPLGINDGPLAHLNNAVAWLKASFASGIQELNVRPLISVVMHVVGDLAEKDPFGSQHTVSLPQERRKGVGKRIVILLGGADDEPEALVEILGLVPSLVWNVRRIVHHHVQTPGPERHAGIVTHNIRVTMRVNIETRDRAFAPAPEPAPIDCCIQDLPGCSSWIETQHLLDEPGIIAKPD
jgi:hypothetical protein